MKKVLVILLLVTLVIAEEINVGEKNDTTGISARRRNRLGLGGGHVWIAGLHALGIFVAIKFKLIIIALFIGFSIFYGLKVWAGSKLFGGSGCAEHGGIIHEPYIPYEQTPYHGHTEYSNYPGPPDHEISGYSSYPGVEHSYSGPEHTGYSGAFNDPSLFKDTGNLGTEIIPNEPYRRQRSFDTKKRQVNNWTDIAFTFLGVDSNICRKRLICEMDFRVPTNPMIGYAYNLISQEFFADYRNVDEKLKDISDCQRIYSECKSFGDKNDENLEDFTLSNEDNNNNNDTEEEDDENNNGRSIINEITTEENKNIISEQIGRLILRRNDKKN